MSLATAPTQPKLMTYEEFLELPQDDGVHRELIDGELRERPMTVRNRNHSRVEARITHLLLNWLDMLPEPRGEVHCGEAGFLLKRDPARLVGADVAYLSDEKLRKAPSSYPYHEVPPTLAVEVLSPSDTQADIEEKVTLYLEAGTVVWVVNPVIRTVSIFRDGLVPDTRNAFEELPGEPYLPGFGISVARFFE